MAPVKLDDFMSFVSDLDRSSFANDLDRKQAVVAVQALLARLQSPREMTTQLLHTGSYLIAAVKSLVHLELFEQWEQDGAQPKTAQQLGHLTGADPRLLERLLRIVVASRMLSTNGDGKYVFTDFARGLASGRLSHSWMLHSLTTANSVVALPKYLKAMSYRNPNGSQDSPWAYHMGMPFIEFLKSNPEAFTHVSAIMKLKNIDTVPWFSFYPVDNLIDGLSPEGAVLVDIGGGTGYDIKAFYHHLRNSGPIDGRLVLQDLAQVVEEASDLPPAIIKQPYDFFTEQPVIAARAYFMHNVLHDWATEECRSILARVKAAMRPGYSRLLINEHVISHRSMPSTCATDLSMMTVNGGSERTEAQWHDLLVNSGFRVIKVHLSPAADESLIEAEV